MDKLKSAAEKIVIFIALFFIFVSFFVGTFLGRERERDIAIENGAAHWTIDEKTGETAFEYYRFSKPDITISDLKVGDEEVAKFPVLEIGENGDMIVTPEIVISDDPVPFSE